MNKASNFYIKNQEYSWINEFKEESAQYGSLRWAAELRANEYGQNKIAVPVGGGIEGNRIWMHLRQPRKSPPDIFIKPYQNISNPSVLNFRNNKYLSQLKKRL